MKSLDIYKAISNAFNSSMSYEEFLMKLDLLGVNVNDAEKTYSLHFTQLLGYKFCNSWTIDGKISFKKMFMECDFVSIVLPFELSKCIDKDSFTSKLQIKACVNGNEISINASYDLIEDIQAMHGIDIAAEILQSLLGTLSYECAIYRRRGVGHGKV